MPAPGSVRAGIGLAGRPLHAAARRPAPPVPSRTPLRRSDRANARCSAASIEGVWECRPTFVTAKAPDPLYPPRPLCASRVALACPRKPRGRACTTPIAPTRIALLPRRRRAAFAPNFCNGQGLRHPIYSARPLRLTSPTSAPASMFCMRLRPGSRIDRPAAGVAAIALTFYSGLVTAHREAQCVISTHSSRWELERTCDLDFAWLCVPLAAAFLLSVLRLPGV